MRWVRLHACAASIEWTGMPWAFKAVMRDFAQPMARAMAAWLGVVSFTVHFLKWGVTGVSAGAKLPAHGIPPGVPIGGWPGFDLVQLVVSA